MNNREEITKLVRGELTYKEAYELENRLHSRSDIEIVEDLKMLDFESLLNTRNCIEDGIENNKELDNAENRKCLQLLEIALKERMNSMLDAEKQVKEILCNY